MRYHIDLDEFPIFDRDPWYGTIYSCSKHPVYNVCTLYEIGEKGLAVIQQRFDPMEKTTKWGPVNNLLVDQIYLHPKFKRYFDKYAAEKDKDGLYPTVTLRQIMWALRMKPLKKERWETTFDRCPI